MLYKRFDSKQAADYHPLWMTFASAHSRMRVCFGCVWLLVLILTAQNSHAAPRIKHQESKRDAKHEIEAMEEQWRTAQIAGDVATMDRLLADDFVGISMTGQANNKPQQLDRYKKRTLAITRIDLEEQKIKLLGAVAIVTSLARVEGVNDGDPIRGVYRYTRVYQRASGVWKTTNFEATRVPPAAASRH